MKINIVGGSGIMGQIHKKIFEKYGHTVIVSGRRSIISPIDAAKDSDITIISVPIDATEKTIKEVAPYCKAICDFTSLKKFPVKFMLKYSKNECEVVGFHPLYGEVSSIKDRTIVVCKTSKTKKICEELINCFKKEGVNLIEMSIEEHDKKVVSINQSLRIKMLAAFLKTINDEEKIFSKIYGISPPPTKVILDLLARQLSHENDSMYKEIISKDEFSSEIDEKFIKNFNLIKEDYQKSAENLRNYIGNDIKKLKENAKNKIGQSEKQGI